METCEKFGEISTVDNEDIVYDEDIFWDGSHTFYVTDTSNSKLHIFKTTKDLIEYARKHSLILRTVL